MEWFITGPGMKAFKKGISPSSLEGNILILLGQTSYGLTEDTMVRVLNKKFGYDWGEGENLGFQDKWNWIRDKLEVLEDAGFVQGRIKATPHIEGTRPYKDYDKGPMQHYSPDERRKASDVGTLYWSDLQAGSEN